MKKNHKISTSFVCPGLRRHGSIKSGVSITKKTNQGGRVKANTLRKTKIHNFCVTFEEDDSCDVIYISEKKKGRGKKISSKEMGEKGIVFLQSETKVM